MKKVLIAVAAVLGVLFVVGLLAGGDNGSGGDDNGGDNVETRGQVSADAAAAGCLPVERSKLPEDAPKHVNGEVDYEDVPPNHGDHSPRTLRNAKRFYTREDKPSIEQAVHNLEHGLVVAWYDNELPDDQVRILDETAQGISTRYVVVPWTRSAFEDDRHFVLTAWGVTQRCRSVSEAVIKQFVEDHADTLAPEKGYSV